MDDVALGKRVELNTFQTKKGTMAKYLVVRFRGSFVRLE
jgi:hypothetical protein